MISVILILLVAVYQQILSSTEQGFNVYLIETPWQMQGMCLFKEAIHFIMESVKNKELTAVLF